MPSHLITLTTDFGEGSPYVAQMKAAALTVNPQLSWVDITHSIRPQDIRHGALVLADTAHQFPAGTLHIAVVDPGVGTARNIVYAEIGQQRFIAPDNGLLSLTARDHHVACLRVLESRHYWRPEVSATFHGRDIMAPVAAHLSLGTEPQLLGNAVHELQSLDWPVVKHVPHGLEGHVVRIDRFGNLITNIERSMLPSDLSDSAVRVTCDQSHSLDIVQTYGQAEPGTAVALIGSGGRLELAIVNGNAAHTLAAGVNSCVQVLWN